LMRRERHPKWKMVAALTTTMGGIDASHGFPA
jgi:hypothetical protein